MEGDDFGDMKHILIEQDKWLLAIINSNPYIDGRTRLQKYGLLSFKEVLNTKIFFSDWVASNYGGYSQQLADSLTKLIKHNYVSCTVISTEYNNVDRYTLTGEGTHMVDAFILHNLLDFEKIKKLTTHYFLKRLNVLLADVYDKYPSLTVNSKIKADVNRARDSGHLSDNLLSDEQSQIPISTIPIQQHVFGDEYFRSKLAKSIGLDRIPDVDPKAFDRIQGIVYEETQTEDFDADELIREVRGC